MVIYDDINLKDIRFCEFIDQIQPNRRMLVYKTSKILYPFANDEMKLTFECPELLRQCINLENQYTLWDDSFTLHIGLNMNNEKHAHFVKWLKLFEKKCKKHLEKQFGKDVKFDCFLHQSPNYSPLLELRGKFNNVKTALVDKNTNTTIPIELTYDNLTNYISRGIRFHKLVVSINSLFYNTKDKKCGLHINIDILHLSLIHI